MKIYITTHGEYDSLHISLCTTDFDLAIKHFLDYSKTTWYNIMYNIEIWEDNKQIFKYGFMKHDIINNKKDISYDDIINDILKQLNKKGINIETNEYKQCADCGKPLKLSDLKPHNKYEQYNDVFCDECLEHCPVCGVLFADYTDSGKCDRCAD